MAVDIIIVEAYISFQLICYIYNPQSFPCEVFCRVLLFNRLWQFWIEHIHNNFGIHSQINQEIFTKEAFFSFEVINMSE